MTAVLLVTVAISLIALSAALLRVLRARREAFVRTYMFPVGLFDRLAKKRPELSLKDRQLVAHTLRKFFLAVSDSGGGSSGCSGCSGGCSN